MWKAIFAGDIVINKKLKNNFINKEILDIIKDHDLAVCNFEAPILTKDAKPIKKLGPHLSQINNAPQIIKEAGFNAFNLANNHIYDFGPESLKKTIEDIGDSQIFGAGMNFNEAYSLKIKTINNTKIGLLGFAEAGFGAILQNQKKQSGYAWINHPQTNDIIKEAKKITDTLIVFIHAGTENVPLPLPEWRQRYKEIINAGADLIIGTHPHVPQGWETYKGKPIFYSLGNSFFPKKNPPKNWNKSFLVSLHFNKTKIIKIKIIPIKNKKGEIVLNKDENYKKYLKDLCQSLQEPKYTELVNKQSLDLWENHYKEYHLNSLNFNEKSRLKRLKNSIKYLLNKKDINHEWLWHNTAIESHHWTTRRALSIINKIY